MGFQSRRGRWRERTAVTSYYAPFPTYEAPGGHRAARRRRHLRPPHWDCPANGSGQANRIAVAPVRLLGRPLLAGLRQGLRDLGWIEGRNIVFELRYADGRIDHLPGLAAELVRQNVEVIVAGSNAGALAAKQATGTIPIVMATTGNPIAGGLAETLARPGANVTGVTSSVGPRGAEPRRRRGPVRWRGGRERPATGQLYPSERGASGQAPSCQRHSRTRRAKPPFMEWPAPFLHHDRVAIGGWHVGHSHSWGELRRRCRHPRRASRLPPRSAAPPRRPWSARPGSSGSAPLQGSSPPRRRSTQPEACG